MGDIKERLTEGVRKILEEKYTGKEFDEELAQKISEDVCQYLWDNGLPEEILPVIDISVDDDGYVSIEVDRYPNEEDLN